jgi:hypothetical protein
LFIGGSYSRNSPVVAEDPPAPKESSGPAGEETPSDQLITRQSADAAPTCPAKSHINQCTCNFELELSGNYQSLAAMSTSMSARATLN